jgi:pimeloyl-ACP methyl ester carboxylesterase
MHYAWAGIGPPILLIPGLLGGSFCWRFTLPPLSEHYTVYAVDLPGLSQADEAGIDCSMSTQAERMLAFVELMGWKNLTLIGSSFGGAIAMLLAARDARASGQIRGLILCAPVNPWSHFGRGRIRFFNTSLGGYFLRTGLPISRPCHGIAIRRMYGNPARMPLDAVEGYRRSVLRRGRAQNVLTALQNWQQHMDSLAEAVSHIRIPTLLLWGDRDRAVDPQSAAELQQRLPCTELKLIPGAGHFPFEEAPEEFNRAVLAFLNKKRDVGNVSGQDRERIG